jgi:RNA polymerase primary sigma factor
MIAGLCESPLTFQAIIIWRDELNEGKVFLREIIDLEATYAGPDAKAMPAPVIGPDGQPGQPGVSPPAGAAPGTVPLVQTPAPPAAPVSATPFKPAPERANGEEGEGADTPAGEADFDDDDMENSLAAIEAELTPMPREAPVMKRVLPLSNIDVTACVQRMLRRPPSPPANLSVR